MKHVQGGIIHLISNSSKLRAYKRTLKRTATGRRKEEKEGRKENNHRKEKLASTLQKRKSHFKVSFNPRVPGYDDFYHHKKGQESLKGTALLKYFRGYDPHPVLFD
ncbi:unnamed protein product [Prunus armeniaca]|uniref:Uncharacterized protein n=1 Tax=Prunus armeniaca TaxID=36596 RepID=A0A6J5WHD6_PRUAR|nr:unnamed protein product [Prunus armeniaca]